MTNRNRAISAKQIEYCISYSCASTACVCGTAPSGAKPMEKRLAWCMRTWIRYMPTVTVRHEGKAKGDKVRVSLWVKG